ncbi:hypothetical protein LI177_10780 [bacterium 210820-DFI.6.37]|nr:hypothetical protein [bacterium 210820-DFI.6.37]
MKIKIRTEKIRFSIAVPTSMAAWAAKKIPQSAIDAMRKKTAEPYRQLVTRENFRFLLNACSEELKANKGLEAVHVEAADGTFVSVIL